MKNILIALMLITFSCQSQKMNPNETSESEEKVTKEIVTGFLNWYTLNKPSIDSIMLVPASLDDDPDNAYFVNMDNLERFLQMIKSSGYLSEHYISTLKKYIVNCDLEMRKINQTDGPPEGLEFDLILRTNETANTISKIESGIHFSDFHIQRNKVTVKVELVYVLSFELVKNGGRWSILRIF